MQPPSASPPRPSPFRRCDMLLIRYMNNYGAPFVESAVFPALVTLAGGAMHPSVLVSRHEICEPALQTVGAHTVFSWKAWLQPHTYNGHTLILGAVRVGARGHFMPGACAFPSAELRAGVTVGRKSLVMKSELLPQGTWWAGVPALHCRPGAAEAAPAFAPFGWTAVEDPPGGPCNSDGDTDTNPLVRGNSAGFLRRLTRRGPQEDA